MRYDYTETRPCLPRVECAPGAEEASLSPTATSAADADTPCAPRAMAQRSGFVP
jgi:hypothetical protein